MRPFVFALLLAVTSLLAGCAQPGTTGAAPAARDTALAPATPAPPATTGTTRAPAPAFPETVPATRRDAPPMSDPLPPERVEDARAAPPSTACRTDSDCAVKDVGSCCGAKPACVNKNAAVDPAAVKAQCAKDGRMSICGFEPVESCSCVAGSCKSNVMMTN